MRAIRSAVILLAAVPFAACEGDDPFPVLPGRYTLVTVEGAAPPVMVLEDGAVRMYVDSMFVEFREDTTSGADGIYAVRWRFEHRRTADDSTYFVGYTEERGTWNYTSDRDVELRRANGALRTRGTRDRDELHLRQFFALDVDDWIFERTSRGPDLLDDPE